MKARWGYKVNLKEHTILEYVKDLLGLVWMSSSVLLVEISLISYGIKFADPNLNAK